MAKRGESKTAKIKAVLAVMPNEQRDKMPMIRSALKKAGLGQVNNSIIYSARNSLKAENGNQPVIAPSEVISESKIMEILTFTGHVQQIGIKSAKAIITSLEKMK